MQTHPHTLATTVAVGKNDVRISAHSSTYGSGQQETDGPNVELHQTHTHTHTHTHTSIWNCVKDQTDGVEHSPLFPFMSLTMYRKRHKRPGENCSKITLVHY